jgi:poly-beta-hydroxyalkanoate depolymerase
MPISHQSNRQFAPGLRKFKIFTRRYFKEEFNIKENSNDVLL